MTRILVLTLHSGENEFEAGKASLAAQTLPPVEQIVFSGLGNAEAHAALYRRIMQESANFDLFLKLDADMVLSRPTALAEVAALFVAHDGLDHIEVSVFDHFTGSLIHGIHVYSSRVKWRTETHDPLFVDPKPDYPGAYLLDPPGLPPFADHAPNPSAFQAFHFGYHRALKAFQPGRRAKRLDWIRAQMKTLDQVRQRYRETGDPKLGLALIAADLVESGKLSGMSGEKEDPAVRAAFLEATKLTSDDIHARLRKARICQLFRRPLWRVRVWSIAHIAQGVLGLMRRAHVNGRKMGRNSNGNEV